MQRSLLLISKKWAQTYFRPLSTYFRTASIDFSTSAQKDSLCKSLKQRSCITVIPGSLQTRSFCASENTVQFLGERLNHRRLIKIKGQDSYVFLQGLITNDIRCLESPSNPTALYSMILNAQGRVMYDILLYKIQANEPTVLLECNSDVLSELITTLEKYKLRKKLKIFDMGEELQVSAVFYKDLKPSLLDMLSLRSSSETLVQFYTLDPRIKDFAYRVVTPSGVKVEDVVKNCEEVTDVYQTYRYKIGLSEGTVDLPPGHCLPLESNLVFLNGVTFDKGCYVGQELTARTHHTGVIRKRLMPVVLSSDQAIIKTGAVVENSSGKSCGKVRNVTGRYGLALLRLDEAIGQQQLIIKDDKDNLVAEASTFIPHWWSFDSDEILKQIIAKRQTRNQEK